MEDRISELSDDILSYILTMLSMKDLFKTSILSRRWCNLWALRKDLFFDIFMLGSNEDDLLQSGYLIEVPSVSTIDRYVDLNLCTDEFVKLVNQFVKKFQGTKIDSFLVNFYINSKHNNIIDQWISFAIARGVVKVDLLFKESPYAHCTTRRNLCKIDFALFLETNASTLNHICLENCIVFHPTNCDFTPLKNLKSLSLDSAKLDETFIESLLSNCPQLEELCLLFCELKSLMPEIVSSSLCHLKAIGCYFVYETLYRVEVNLILLDCLNLTSLELDCLEFTSLENGLNTMNFNTPVLKRIEFFISLKQELNTYVALCATFFPELEIMQLSTLSMVTTSLQTTQPLKHLKQLNLFIFLYSEILDDVEYDPLWILNILQVCPFLQKLSAMFADPKLFDNQKDIRDVETFSHDEVKVIELGGCVGNWYEIEFVMNVLKYAHKLEQIVVSPFWREDESLDWKSNPIWFQGGREKLSGQVQGEKLVIV